MARTPIQDLLILSIASLATVAPAHVHAFSCPDDFTPDREAGSFGYGRESPEDAVIWRVEICGVMVLDECALISDDDRVAVERSESACADTYQGDGGRTLVTYRPQRLLLPGRQYTLDCGFDYGPGYGPRIEVVDGLAMPPPSLEGIGARIHRDNHVPLCGEYEDYLELDVEFDADGFFAEGGRIDLYLGDDYFDTVTSERRLGHLRPLPSASEFELRVVASDGETNTYTVDLGDLPRDPAFVPSCAVAPIGGRQTPLLLLALAFIARRPRGRR